MPTIDSTGYTVDAITTPTNQLLTWDSSESTRTPVAARAHAGQFSTIPVTSDGRIVGTIQSDALSAGGGPEPLAADSIIASDTPILKLLSLFAANAEKVYLVLKETEFIGMVAPADLNKIPARASVYLLTARFEEALMRLISSTSDDNEDAYIAYLSDDRRQKLEDSRSRDRANDIHLDPINYLYLNDLTAIVAKEPKFCDVLGLPTEDIDCSHTQRKDRLSVSTVRNAVSHLTKPLIHERGDLVKVNSDCQRMIWLSDRIDAHIQQRQSAKV